MQNTFVHRLFRQALKVSSESMGWRSHISDTSGASGVGIQPTASIHLEGKFWWEADLAKSHINPSSPHKGEWTLYRQLFVILLCQVPDEGTSHQYCTEWLLTVCWNVERNAARSAPLLSVRTKHRMKQENLVQRSRGWRGGLIVRILHIVLENKLKSGYCENASTFRLGLCIYNAEHT